MSRVIQPATQRRLLLALLVGLYPSAFFASNNWYGFTSAQIVTLIAAAVAMSFIAVSSLAAALSLTVRGLARRSKKAAPDRATDALWALTGLAVCLGLSGHLLAAAPPFAPIVLVAATLALGGAAWAYRSGLSGLNVLLLGLTLLTAVQWAYSYIDIRSQLDADHWFNARRKLNDRIRFDRTPNVYYLLAESYPSRSALKRIYNFEQPDFYRELEQRRFEIHHDAFSNYQATVLSMSSMFAMDHHYAKYSIGNLDSYHARDVISANLYNAVVDVFQRNGYRIEYVHEYAYQVRKGADIDYLWPPASVLSGLWAFLGRQGLHEDVPGERIDYSNDFRDAIIERLTSLATSESPRFSYIYLGAPGHSSGHHNNHYS